MQWTQPVREMRSVVRLATALANGNELSAAVKFAAAAGAAAVTVLGATPSMPTREKIEAILSER